jgi:hypothetical protein
MTDEEKYMPLTPLNQSMIRIFFERQINNAMVKEFSALRNEKGYYLFGKISLLENVIKQINPLQISTTRILK